MLSQLGKHHTAF